MDREELEDAVYLIMLCRPDHAYVLPDGSALYLLNDEGEMFRIEGEGLNLMTVDEINLFIQSSLS